jgi:cob(II)yrinic acid a,c-diamide reductase
MWVMTSAFEGRRAGVMVKSVCACADEPLLLAVAAWKGHGIEPMVRDSHHFGVSLIDPEDRLLLRRFTGHLTEHPDQFDTVATERLVSGSPLLKRARVAFDCEVVRHFDMEADHELYVGLVIGSRMAEAAGGHGHHSNGAHGPGGTNGNGKPHHRNGTNGKH